MSGENRSESLGSAGNCFGLCTESSADLSGICTLVDCEITGDVIALCEPRNPGCCIGVFLTVDCGFISALSESLG